MTATLPYNFVIQAIQKGNEFLPEMTGNFLDMNFSQVHHGKE